MLKRFEVSNCRTFENIISIDFSNIGGYQYNQDCITDNIMSKMIMYGRNATGKTNFGRAIMDIAEVISPLETKRLLSASSFLNADSSERFATFKYVFQFGTDEVTYQYKKLSAQKLLDERLIINEQEIFYVNFEESIGIYPGLGVVDADTVVIERYRQSLHSINEDITVSKSSLPFLRWLINNTALQENSILLRLDDYIQRMRMVQVGGTNRGYSVVLTDLLSIEDNLRDFEHFLNIMGIKCELRLEPLPEGEKELYFVHNRLVPFWQTASSGTKALADLYVRLSVGRDSSFMYIDEFDAFYHYEMSENVLRYFKARYPRCQLMLTTHNTNLMTNKLMRPDCVFILSRDGRLTALCDATTRELREGHNLEKMYISGEFDRFE